jgi:hypothetical protein
MNLFYIERGFYRRTEIGEREIDRSTDCTYHVCSWKQYIIWLFASPPPLSLWLDKSRQVVSSPATLSPPSSHLPPPPHTIPHWDNFQLPRYILRMASGRAGSQPSVDYTTFYSQDLCEEGSRPQQHTWNSKPLLFSR